VKQINKYENEVNININKTNNLNDELKIEEIEKENKDLKQKLKQIENNLKTNESQINNLHETNQMIEKEKKK